MNPSVQQPATATVAPPPIPYKRDAGGPVEGLGGGAAAVVAVSLVVIGVVLFLRKRLNLVPLAPGAGGLLRVLERHPLGPRAVLVVVEFEGRRHVLAHTEHGVSRVIGAESGESA